MVIRAPSLGTKTSLRGTIHADPADRLLLATAWTERMALVTTDRKLLAYPHADTLN